MRSLLVTGGAGFIGSNFVHLAAARLDVDIIVLDSLSYAGNLANIRSLIEQRRVTFVKGDICDSDLVTNLMREHNTSAVVHFAAETHVDRSILGPAPFLSTNINGTACLLECAHQLWSERRDRKHNRFLHVSTDEVYGTLAPDEPAFNENTPYRPNSPYSASKAASDHLVRAWHTTFGMPAIVTNCSNNYGPRQFPEKLIPLMILNAIAGKPLPVYGDGKQIRDWLHVDDHCEALLSILQHGEVGETYCIGGDSERTNLEIVRLICEIVDARTGRKKGSSAMLIERVKDRPGHDRRYAIDASKTKAAFNWTPRHQLEAALHDIVAWYSDNPGWCAAIRDGSYRDYYRQQYESDAS